VIGKWSVVSGQWSVVKGQNSLRPAGRPCVAAFIRRTTDNGQRTLATAGFTLLELMIVISIIIILAAIVLPQYQKTVIQAREAVLKDDLLQMRKMLDQYAADKGELPQSLEQLVEAGYLRELPLDPVTDERNWQQISGPDASTGGQGVIDVRSASGEQGSDGRPYSDW